MEEKIKALCEAKQITSKDEIQLVIKAILQKNDELVLEEEIFTKKKWKEFKSDLMSSEKKFGLIRVKWYPIYTRFPIQSKPPTSQVIKCIVMGPCGNGKTCLINHLCGSDLPTGHVKSSLTREITELKSQFKYDRNFVIYDTPGTTSKEDKLRHAIHLKELINFKPINSVLVLVKYESRYDDLVDKIYKQVKMLKGYESNIIFAVSHFDLAEDPNVAINGFDKAFNQLKIHNQIIFYSNKGVDEKELCDKIYQISKSLPQKQFIIDEDDFFKYFNLQKQETEELIFKEDEEKIKKQMNQITEIYIENAVALPQNNERDAIFQDLECALRNELLDLFDGFVKRFQNTMSIMEYYKSYYKLQLKINENMSKYEQRIRKLQNYNLIESTVKEDIRDLVKQCPNHNCGLYWFRVEECPETVCGNRPSCTYDFMRSKYFRYQIKRDKETRKLKIKKVEEIINKKKKNFQKQKIADKLISFLEEQQNSRLSRIIDNIHCEYQQQYWNLEKIIYTINVEFERQMYEGKQSSRMQFRFFQNLMGRIGEISVFEKIEATQQQEEELEEIENQIENIFSLQKQDLEVNEINKQDEKYQKQLKQILINIRTILKSSLIEIGLMDLKSHFKQQLKNALAKLKQIAYNVDKFRKKLTESIGDSKQQLEKIKQSLKVEIKNFKSQLKKISENLNHKIENQQKQIRKKQIIQEIKTILLTDQEEQRRQMSNETINLSQINDNQNIQEQTLPFTTKQVKPYGCGQYMNFKILPRLSNIEEILIQWYQVTTFEQVLEIVNEEQKLRQTKKKMQSQIRSELQKLVTF